MIYLIFFPLIQSQSADNVDNGSLNDFVDTIFGI